jgi:hypothetical protein
MKSKEPSAVAELLSDAKAVTKKSITQQLRSAKTVGLPTPEGAVTPQESEPD